MEIYLIRHTSPEVGKGVIYGRMDVPLADSFEKEQLQVISQLPDQAELICTSPSSRCTKLAAIISSVYPGADYVVDDALMELDFGDWEGKTWDEVAGPVCDHWMNDFVNVPVPGGESMLQMEQRISLFFKRLLQQPYRNAIVITHGGVMRIVLAHYRSVALQESFSIKIGMGEVFKLSVSSW